MDRCAHANWAKNIYDTGMCGLGNESCLGILFIYMGYIPRWIIVYNEDLNLTIAMCVCWV